MGPIRQMLKMIKGVVPCNNLRKQSYFYTNLFVNKIIHLKINLMARFVLSPAALTVALICLVGFAGLAWQQNPAIVHNPAQHDTIPGKHHAKEDKTVITGDIDKALNEVKKAQKNLEKQFENKNWDQMHRQLEQSLANIDAERIEEQVAKAMKEIDMEKIRLQAQEAIKQIDWQKMQAEMEKMRSQIANIDGEKMQKEMQKITEATKKAIAEIKAPDMEKIERELEASKEALKMNEGKMKENLERARNSIKENLKKDFRKELDKAQQGVERAAEELQNYKNMLMEMDKDGLLKADGPYDIHYKNGELTIDGKLQPATVTDKYKHYFRKENVRIRRSKNDEDDRTIDL